MDDAPCQRTAIVHLHQRRGHPAPAHQPEHPRNHQQRDFRRHGVLRHAEQFVDYDDSLAHPADVPDAGVRQTRETVRQALCRTAGEFGPRQRLH